MKRLKRIVDTDVFIDHLRGYESARGYIQQFEDGKPSGAMTS